MLTEKERPHSRMTTLLIKLQGEGKTVYEPVMVNEAAHDATTKFIIEEKNRLKKRLENLRTMPAKRSGREIRDIRISREKLINKEQLEEKLSILKGDVLQPIRLILKKNTIKGFEIAYFEQEEQKRWWTYIKQKGRMSAIVKIAQDFPEGLGLLSDLYNIRYTMKYGSSKEANQAKEDLDSLRLRTSATPEEHDVLMVPLYRMITDDLGS